MAINTKPHRVIDHPLSNRHLGEIPMAVGAIHLGPDVGRMIEPDVILRDKSINPLPGQILAFLGRRADGLDPGILLIADILVAAHAHIDTGNAGSGPFHHSGVAGIAGYTDIVRMDLVWKINRLHGFGPDAQEIFRCRFKAGMRGREDGRTPPLRRIRVAGRAGVSRYLRLLHATHGERRNK